MERKGGPEDVTKVRDQAREWVASCLVNSCLKKAAKQWGMRVGRGVGEDHVVCRILIVDEAKPRAFTQKVTGPKPGNKVIDWESTVFL